VRQRGQRHASARKRENERTADARQTLPQAHRSGCMVTSATSSGSASSSRKFFFLSRLYASYSGRWRPAWRKSLRARNARDGKIWPR
jgi:hypothetical protein